MKNSLITFLFITFLLTSTAFGQDSTATDVDDAMLTMPTTTSLFNPDDTRIGARVVLGGVYGANFGLAVEGERGLRDLDVGGSTITIGAGGGIDFSRYSTSFFGGEWSYTNVAILGSGYAHMDLSQVPNLDLFASIHLGYNIVTSKWSGTGTIGSASSSYFATGITVGGRYYFMPNMAAVAEVGFGTGYLRLGVDFEI